MKEVLLFASFLLFSLVAKAQNVDQLEAQADEWSKQSYTQSKALSAYLSCIRQTKEKNGLFRLVDKTTSIVKNKKFLLEKDIFVVDSIIDIIRPMIEKDKLHFLSLLEQRIMRSSDYKEDYLEEVAKLRQANNLQHDAEYERLLQLYIIKLLGERQRPKPNNLITDTVYKQKLLRLKELIGPEVKSFEVEYAIYEYYYSKEDTTEARKIAIEFASWVEQKLGKRNETYCKSLELIIKTYKTDDTKAIPLLKELLMLQGKVFGKNHSSYEETLKKLTSSLSQNHQIQELIKILSTSTDKNDIFGLQELGRQQMRYGLYREAIETYEEILKYCVENQSDASFLSIAILEISNCYKTLKDMNGFLALGSKWSNDNRLPDHVRRIIFKELVNWASLPDRANEDVIKFINSYILSNPSVASSGIEWAELLAYKAQTYFGMKKPELAESIIRQILKSLKQANEENSIIIKYELCLEICLWAQDQWRKALAQNQKIRSMMNLFPDYKKYLEYQSLCCRAIIYSDMTNNFDKVLKFCTEIDEFIPIKTLFLGHQTISLFTAISTGMDKSSVETQRYRALYKKGYKEEAKEIVKQDITEKMSLIKFTLSQMDNSMQQNTTVWTKQANDNLCNIAVLCGEDSLSTQVFDYTLLYKQAFLTAENLMREQLLNSGNEELKAKFSELQNLRATVQQYEKSGLSADELSERIIQLDKQLIEDSKMYGDFTNGLSLTWDKVQKLLKQDDIAIEFLSYTSFEDNEEHIAALLLRPNWERPKLIHLFSVKQLPDKIYENQQFSQLCWGAIDDYLDGVRNIYFAPAGVLYNIGIESLLLPEGDGYMAEKYNLYRISSTRELVMNSDDKQTAQSKAAIYGGIDYQSKEEKRGSHASAHEDEENSVLRDLRGAISHIPYLPKSKEEAENVAEILGIKNHKEAVQLFTGIAGTESTFKSISGGSFKIVHIATHGFYNESPKADKSSPAFYLLQQETEDKALSKSGLLFAGAEKAISGNDNVSPQNDGILTAQEISTLDLRSLDLATLSACQTAQGDISGDGVFGLQRGFKKAGAKSILMSLWKVDDEATSLLMSEFYNNWIINKKTKHDALELAKQTVRSHRDKGWDNPKYWAAFILLDGID